MATQVNGLQPLEVYAVGGKTIIHVPIGRGEIVRELLAAHNVRAIVSRPAEGFFERVEVTNEGEVTPDAVRVLLENWSV